MSILCVKRVRLTGRLLTTFVAVLLLEDLAAHGCSRSSSSEVGGPSGRQWSSAEMVGRTIFVSKLDFVNVGSSFHAS